MAVLKPITIVGGGLAGLTLGIGLRRQGIPATVWEAGHYPRHRVCGEFISGRGQKVLAQLGLMDSFREAGAAAARTAAFFLGNANSPVRPLPAPALCLSRFAMDSLLAKLFRQCGGELREGERWRDGFPEGVVRATGRRLEPPEDGARWFGLKVHARNVVLAADLEMHGLADGYVGVCRLNEDEVNICGLFRRGAASPAIGKSWREILRGVPGAPLRERLAQAELDESSFCSVAGVSLQPVRARTLPECCVGDALTMTPPVTGNGMSMAFEAASLAARPLAGYSGGEMSWAEARHAVACACDQAFAWRLAWARVLQWMMFAPALRSRPGAVVLHSELLWRVMFGMTR